MPTDVSICILCIQLQYTIKLSLFDVAMCCRACIKLYFKISFNNKFWLSICLLFKRMYYIKFDRFLKERSEKTWRRPLWWSLIYVSITLQILFQFWQLCCSQPWSVEYSALVPSVRAGLQLANAWSWDTLANSICVLKVFQTPMPYLTLMIVKMISDDMQWPVMYWVFSIPGGFYFSAAFTWCFVLHDLSGSSSVTAKMLQVLPLFFYMYLVASYTCRNSFPTNW